MSTKNFVVKGHDKEVAQAGGMVRSDASDKIDYSLAFDGPMFKRLASHLTKAAKIYSKRNWMKASNEQDIEKWTATRERYRESAFRHFIQWYNGDSDEDHAAATFFNINGVEYMDGN